MKHVKTRPLCLILLFAIILAITCGCTNESQNLDTKNPVVLTLWHYYNGAQQEAFTSLIMNFNDTVGLEKGILIDPISLGSVDELTKSVAAAAEGVVGSRKMPHIFASYADTAFKMDQLGLLTDFSQYVSPEEIAEYIPSYMSEGQFTEDGGYKLFPIAKSTEVLMLNKTDWNKFATATGATTDSLATWEGIVRTSQSYYEWTDSLTPEPNDGKSFFGIDSLANYLLIGGMQLGCELFSVEDGIVTFSSDETVMRKLWDNYYLPTINGYFNSIGQFRSDDMRTGDLIANIASTSSGTYYSGDVTMADGMSYPIEMDTFSYPVFENGIKYGVQQGAGMAITKSDESHEYAATIFLKWFTEAARNTSFSIETGYLPVKSAANTAESLNAAVAASSTEISPFLNHLLTVAMDMTYDYRLYTSKGFENGYAARSFIETSLNTIAKTDRQTVITSLASGATLEEATAPFTNDAYFQQWYTSFQSGLEQFKPYD